MYSWHGRRTSFCSPQTVQGTQASRSRFHHRSGSHTASAVDNTVSKVTTTITHLSLHPDDPNPNTGLTELLLVTLPLSLLLLYMTDRINQPLLPQGRFRVDLLPLSCSIGSIQGGIFFSCLSSRVRNARPRFVAFGFHLFNSSVTRHCSYAMPLTFRSWRRPYLTVKSKQAGVVLSRRPGSGSLTFSLHA